VLERFPAARVVPLPGVVEYILRAASPQQIASWKEQLPGQIPDTLPLAAPLDGSSFELEGHEFTAINVGHTDTDHTVCCTYRTSGWSLRGRCLPRRPPAPHRVSLRP
jgi:hypothetical protein